jgi:hypothetical protein
MNESEALLIVERGPLASTQFPLQGEQLSVGRGSGNDLVIPDPEISRRHLRIVRRADGFAVEDAGSTNGTFVNGQRISHLTLLQDGDTVDLGDTVRLRFMSLSPTAAGQPPVGLAEKPTQVYQPVAPPVGRPAARPSPVAPQKPAYSPAPPREPAYPYPPPPAYNTQQPRRGRGLLMGCGLLLALLLVCVGTFFVLDAYDQGRLLYCGPLFSFFELVLGPFGFAPICP